MAYTPNNPNGQTTAANSAPVVLATDQTALQITQPDLLITGQGAQTVVGQNIINAVAGAAAIDASGYRSGSVQVISTGTAGTFILEVSNDNVNFVVAPWYNSSLITGVPIVAAITATVSQIMYTFPVKARYVRVRIVTTITGGSLQTFSRLSQESWAPSVMSVAQPTASSLNSNVSGSLTTVATVTALTAVNSIATTNGLSMGTAITSAVPATVSVKASAGRLHLLNVGNSNTSAVYLKIFNVVAPTLGITSANMNYMIPAGATMLIPINNIGLFFSTAIVIAVTGAASLTDNTIITIGCNVNYSFI